MVSKCSSLAGHLGYHGLRGIGFDGLMEISTVSTNGVLSFPTGQVWDNTMRISKDLEKQTSDWEGKLGIEATTCHDEFNKVYGFCSNKKSICLGMGYPQFWDTQTIFWTTQIRINQPTKFIRNYTINGQLEICQRKWDGNESAKYTGNATI